MVISIRAGRRSFGLYLRLFVFALARSFDRRLARRSPVRDRGAGRTSCCVDEKQRAPGEQVGQRRAQSQDPAPPPDRASRRGRACARRARPRAPFPPRRRPPTSWLLRGSRCDASGRRRSGGFARRFERWASVNATKRGFALVSRRARERGRRAGAARRREVCGGARLSRRR
jgi:hypothetical protein